MTPLELVLSKFGTVKKQAGGYQVHCPTHEDKKASLSITEKDGKILLYCFAGCHTSDVLNSIGLEFRNLFTDGRE